MNNGCNLQQEFHANVSRSDLCGIRVWYSSLLDSHLFIQVGTGWPWICRRRHVRQCIIISNTFTTTIVVVVVIVEVIWYRIV